MRTTVRSAPARRSPRRANLDPFPRFHECAGHDAGPRTARRRRPVPEFRDRAHAGRLLARALAAEAAGKPLVLGIPCGGVPVAREVAEALGADLDVVFAHRLPAPGCPECTLGAVTAPGGVAVCRCGCECTARVSRAWFMREAETQMETLRLRQALYDLVRTPVDPAGRRVIVVDDAAVTGATLIAALRAVRAAGPAHLIAAVPVAPRRALPVLRALADEVVCPLSPQAVRSPGERFARFTPVMDEEVALLLARGTPRSRRRAHQEAQNA